MVIVVRMLLVLVLMMLGVGGRCMVIPGHACAQSRVCDGVHRWACVRCHKLHPRWHPRVVTPWMLLLQLLLLMEMLLRLLMLLMLQMLQMLLLLLLLLLLMLMLMLLLLLLLLLL